MLEHAARCNLDRIFLRGWLMEVMCWDNAQTVRDEIASMDSKMRARLLRGIECEHQFYSAVREFILDVETQDTQGTDNDSSSTRVGVYANHTACSCHEGKG